MFYICVKCTVFYSNGVQCSTVRVYVVSSGFQIKCVNCTVLYYSMFVPEKIHQLLNNCSSNTRNQAEE